MPVAILVPLALLFASVAVAVGMLASYVIRRSSAVERRLRNLPETSEQRVLTLTELDLQRESYGRLEAYARYLPRSSKELAALRRRMEAAGFDRPEAAIVYALCELALPVIVGGLVLALAPAPRGYFIALLAGALAYMLPGLWLGNRVADRRRQIQNALPDALDLLLVSIEAGSGLDQALLKVSSELEFAYPVLADEFSAIVSEIRAGRSRVDALRQFSERAKIDDVRSLVMTLIQTDRFGTSVGQALRTHADTARTRRRQRAEERAQKVGVKLVFPLVFCLLPAMGVVVLGPAVLRIIRMFGTP
ncbi:MAG: type II secretion system F family protein [Vicinamibacterales bacterium]